MSTTRKGMRKQQILECLARMLETSPGGRITTAALAAEVNVSEAALYRHFPSKSKMFESLIAFIEDTLFSRIKLIINEETDVISQCYKILTLVLSFAERNPGISRLLTGDALTGETATLHKRVEQLFDRLETQLKQLLKEAEIKQGLRTTLTASAAANLLVATTEGKIRQFVRSRFNQHPTQMWNDQWQVLMQGFFIEVSQPHQ